MKRLSKKAKLEMDRARIRADLEWHRARDWRDPEPEIYPPAELDRAARHRQRSYEFHARGE